MALENRGGGYLSFISNYKKKKRQAVFSSRTLFHAECEYILNKEGFFFFISCYNQNLLTLTELTERQETTSSMEKRQGSSRTFCLLMELWPQLYINGFLKIPVILE